MAGRDPTLERWRAEYVAAKLRRIREVVPADHPLRADFEQALVGQFEPPSAASCGRGCRCGEPARRGPGAPGFMGTGSPLGWLANGGAQAAYDLASPGAVTSATRSFGLSTMQLERQPDRFGTIDEQLDDAERLGARVIREPGGINLTWNALVNDEVRLGREAVIAQTNTVVNQGRFETFFRSLWSRGLRVILRFPLADDRVTDDEAEAKETAGYPHLDLAEPLKLDWSAEHDPADIGDWDFILDIRRTYHLNYLSYMAEGVARLLEAVEAQLEGAFTVADVVFAIEVFPNVDGRNVQPIVPDDDAVGDATGNGERWGFAWSYTSEVLRRQLAARLVAVPAFLLPAISSHYETVLPSGKRSRNSLDYLLEFFGVLVGKIVSYDASWSGGAVMALTIGVNYGWDHRSQKDSKKGVKREGLLHMGHHKREIALVEEVLEGSGLKGLSVYVLDTGQSVSDDDEVVPNWMSDREEFQAYDVWRRVAGAVACGAAVSGWRSWMSLVTEAVAMEHGQEGYGMGLRDDEFGYSGTNEKTAAVPRSSWFAYQRVVETLGALPVARLVYPKVHGTDEPDVGSGLTALLIYRFTSAFAGVKGSGTNVYVILADATASQIDGWCLAVDWAETTSAADGTCVKRATLPSASVAGGDGLPTGTPTWEGDAMMPVPATFGFQAGRTPMLLSANHPLQFTVDYCPAQPFDVPPEQPRTPPRVGTIQLIDPYDPYGVTVYVDGVRWW